MAKHSMKVKGKEIGPAEVYAPPHTMDGQPKLVSAIKGYAENDFPATAGSFSSTDQLNTFIEQAEQRIFNSIQFPVIRKNVTGTTTSGNKYLATPVDFLAPYSLAAIDGTGSYEFLLNKDVNFIRAAYPSLQIQASLLITPCLMKTLSS
jgi:hypothetical protein